MVVYVMYLYSIRIQALDITRFDVNSANAEMSVMRLRALIRYPLRFLHIMKSATGTVATCMRTLIR